MLTKTGDIKQNLNKLISELKLIKYHAPIDSFGFCEGDPTAFLPLIHFILLDYSHIIAHHFASKNYELYGKRDSRFLESVYKLLRDEFNYKPSLKRDQFFSMGFAERKTMFICDLIQFCKTLHANLVRDNSNLKKSKLTTKTDPYPPQPILASPSQTKATGSLFYSRDPTVAFYREQYSPETGINKDPFKMSTNSKRSGPLNNANRSSFHHDYQSKLFPSTASEQPPVEYWREVDSESILNHPPSRFMAADAWSSHLTREGLSPSKSHQPRGPAQEQREREFNKLSRPLFSMNKYVDHELESAVYNDISIMHEPDIPPIPAAPPLSDTFQPTVQHHNTYRSVSPNSESKDTHSDGAVALTQQHFQKQSPKLSSSTKSKVYDYAPRSNEASEAKETDQIIGLYDRIEKLEAYVVNFVESTSHRLSELELAQNNLIAQTNLSFIQRNGDHTINEDSLQFNSSALFKRSSPVREGKENSRETATTNIFKKSFIMKDADSFIRNIEEKFHKINSKTSK